MRSPWLLALFAVLATLLATHAPSLPGAVRGDIAYSYSFDLCEGHFVSEAAPAKREGRPSAEGCDTPYSQRMGWDGWRRAAEAWRARESTLGFLFVDLWHVATDARALNVVDLMVFMWPARLLFEPAAGLAALHLGLVALAVASGVVFARTLGASALAGAAAGIVVGGSGLVLESVQRGQYPQAVLAGALLFFAGLVRIVHGERHGVLLAAGGSGVAALLYWQNGLILGVGAVLFLVGSRLAGPFAAGTFRRLVAGAALAVAVCLVPAAPVIETMVKGEEMKVKVEPLGTPFPIGSTNSDDFVDLIDEVPYFILFSPAEGWIPALPLLPLALVGVARRERVGWALLAVFGATMALGPLPALPDGIGGGVIPGYGAMNRTENPAYPAVYQWVPTASRQRHPMRWATLLLVGMAAATAFGVDRARKKWPDHTLVAVVAGAGWVAWVGPWPLREADFPQEVVDALGSFEALVLPRVPGGERDLDDVHRLEGLLWVPRAPARSRGTTGVGGPTPEMRTWSKSVEEALAARLGGAAPPAEDPLAGTCVIFEKSWFDQDGDRIRASLVRTFGDPAFALAPNDLFMADGTQRRVEVFLPGGTTRTW